MRYEFIQPASLPFLETPTPAVAVLPSHTAQRQLRADYQRWSRLLMGAVGLTLVLLGVPLAIGFPLSGMQPTGPVLGIAALGIVPLGAGTWILIRLHRSGRALVKALSWWTAEPYRQGIAARSPSGWLAARTVNYEPPIFVRIVTGSLLGLFGLMAICVIWIPEEPGDINAKPMMVILGVFWALTAIGQFGGVFRLVSGVAEADPLWVRIRDTFRR